MLGHVVRTDVDGLGGGLFHELDAGSLGMGFGDYFDNQLLTDAYSLTTAVSAFYVFNRYKRFISRFLAFSGKYNPLIQSALQTDLYRGLPTHFSTGRGGSLP